MRKNWAKWMLLGITLVSLILAVGLYGVMPEVMITHWGLYGEPNGWMGKFWALATFPLINLLMLGVYFFVPKFEPRQDSLAAFRKEYDKLMLSIFGFMNYIFLLSVLVNWGVSLDMGKMIMPGMGLMFVVIGMILPKAKQNFMVGIKTPWTLASENVWEKTHVVGGKLFVTAGVVSALSVFLPTAYGFVIAIGSILLVSLGVMVYSYILFREEKKK